MKKYIVLVFFLFVYNSIWSQNLINSPSNISYRNALQEYDNKNYGKSLNFAEDAITKRNIQIEKELKRLENSLSSREVKSCGKDIDKIILKLIERDEKDCINIIESYTKKKGNDYFENNIDKLLEYLKGQKEFPEAQKLIGDIYKIEGEYDFAEEYYLRALKNSDILDIPAEKYEILYTMAELSRLSGNYEQMELRLLNITTSAQQTKNTSLIKSMNNVISKNREDSLEKLLSMYRIEDYYNLDAYCQLSNYYLEKNQMDKALGYCCLSVMTGYTKMITLISKRDMSFEYENLEKFLLEVQNYDDIVSWGKKNKVWESFNQLAKISMKLNYNTFADSLLKALAKSSPDPYWQKEAVLLLDTVDGIK